MTLYLIILQRSINFSNTYTPNLDHQTIQSGLRLDFQYCVKDSKYIWLCNKIKTYIYSC